MDHIVIKEVTPKFRNKVTEYSLLSE